MNDPRGSFDSTEWLVFWSGVRVAAGCAAIVLLVLAGVMA